MRTQDRRLGQTADLFRGLARTAYVPALVVGGAMQLAAVFPGSGSLAAAGLALGAAADLLTSSETNPWRGRLRRAGLGVVQRASIRALLVLAAITVEPVPATTAAWFVIAIIGVVVASRVWRWALDKVAAGEPAMGVLNLGGDAPLAGLFERTRRRRTVGSGVLVSVEIPIGLAMLARAEGVLTDSPVRWTMGVAFLVAVVAAGCALLWSVAFRRSGRVDDHLALLREELERYGAPVVVYFSGAVGTTYQLNQWLPVFDRSTVPILVVIRERHHLEHLVPTGVPVLYCRTTRDVEEALTSSARVALYVANAGRNIHLQRFPQLKHVFLNHGDSDKASSANPVVRVYDLLFVAGEIAIDRYRDGGVDLPRDRFRIVGRPQLDGVQSQPQPPIEGPPTLLYAPTWEGLFDEADYSSVERMGVELVQGMLRHRPDVRVVFKPHPLSGTVRPASRRAKERIEELLREAGAPHVVATGYPKLHLFDWFERADVLLTDISAVATDWLATGRPYIVTNPRWLPEEEFRRRYPSHRAAYVIDQGAESIRGAVDACLGQDPKATERADVARHVLGEHARGPQETFDQALRDVIALAERRWTAHRGARPVDDDGIVAVD